MIKRTLFLSCCALALQAAEPVWSLEAQGSLLFGTGDMHRIREEKNPAGYSVGGAARFQPNPDLSFRLHADLASIKGKPGTGLEQSGPRRTLFGLDVARDAGRFSVFGGLVGVQWKQDEAQATLREFQDYAGTTKVNNAGRGTKLGFRIGVDFALTENVRATASFTQTEFNKLTQPSWLALGVTYRFRL